MQELVTTPFKSEGQTSPDCLSVFVHDRGLLSTQD